MEQGKISISEMGFADRPGPKGQLRIRVVRGMNLANKDLFSQSDPYVTIKMGEQFVYDKDIVFDDKMGNAEVDIGPFVEAVKGGRSVTISVRPNPQNCLAEESKIVWKDGKPIQSMVLGLRNVKCGKVELQLNWIDNPGLRDG